MGKVFLRGMLASEHAATPHTLAMLATEAKPPSSLYTTPGIFWWSMFDSVDGYTPTVTGSASISAGAGGVSMATGTTSGSTGYFSKTPGALLATATWAKVRRLKTKVYFGQVTNQDFWVVSGDIGTLRHVGFKVVNATLYGTVADGTTEATLSIETLTGTPTRMLEVVFTPGVEARFYVDGVDKGTITTNLPSGTAIAEYLFKVQFDNTAAENKIFSISEAMVLQEP